MDHFQGITAEIISNGQVLKLYDDPDAAENEDSDAHHHYVEAVAGSTFKVNVHLTPQFKLNKMKAEHAVKIRVGIDGGHDSALSSYLTKASLQERFTRGRPYDGTFTGVRQFCKETGQWMMCDYSFGDLVLSMPGLSALTKYRH